MNLPESVWIWPCDFNERLGEDFVVTARFGKAGEDESEFGLAALLYDEDDGTIRIGKEMFRGPTESVWFVFWDSKAEFNDEGGVNFIDLGLGIFHS